MIRSRIAPLLAVAALCAAAPLGAQTQKSKKASDTKSATKVPVTPKDTMKAEAKVSRKDAEVVALKEVPGGKVHSHEITKDKGVLVRSFDITVKGKDGVERVRIDATTGKLASKVHLTSAQTKAEADARRDEKLSAPPKKPDATKKP